MPNLHVTIRAEAEGSVRDLGFVQAGPNGSKSGFCGKIMHEQNK